MDEFEATGSPPLLPPPPLGIFFNVNMGAPLRPACSANNDILGVPSLIGEGSFTSSNNTPPLYISYPLDALRPCPLLLADLYIEVSSSSTSITRSKFSR